MVIFEDLGVVGARAVGLLALGTLAGAAQAQDQVQGAMIYMQLANDSRSCIACHGPDPGLNHNNILRAADSPSTLTKVLNSVSAMGFLRPRFTEADRADVTAFLGNIVRINTAAAPLRLWPVTLEFGQTPVGAVSARQLIRLVNPSATTAFAVSSVTSTAMTTRLTHNCPASLPPLASCEVGVQHQPIASGAQRGAILVNGPALTQPMVVGLIGYGTSEPVSQLDWQLPSPSIRMVAEAGGPTIRRTVTLANPGPMPVVLALTSITGEHASQLRVDSGCAVGSVLQAGTSCEITVSFAPGLLPESKAVLQLRSDQGNPDAVLLEGISTPVAKPPAPIENMLTSSGGGCSVGPPGGRTSDPLLWLMVALAIAATWGRRSRRPGTSFQTAQSSSASGRADFATGDRQS